MIFIDHRAEFNHDLGKPFGYQRSVFGQIHRRIFRAYHNPQAAFAYEIGRRLEAMYPGRCIETTDWRFDINDLAGAGRCTVRPKAGVDAQIDEHFVAPAQALSQDVENAWLEVDWEGQHLGVLKVNHNMGNAHRRTSWIVGPTRDVAEAFFRAVCAWSADVRPDVEVLVFEGGIFRKSSSLHRAIRDSSFDDLVLPAPQKAQLRADFVEFFESCPLYRRYDVPWRRGVLFTGPPGNGKTHTVKAVVNQLKKPCLYVRSFEAPCSTEQACMRAVFARARATAPCVLVLEDLDALVHDRNRSFFLNELDGFAQNEGILTVATTNHPERLDPAIAERPSRFDRKYLFALPGAEERRAYLALWSRALEADMRLGEAEVAALAERTEGFSFAYLKELVVSSMIRWLEGRVPGVMARIMAAEADALRAQMTARRDP